MVTPSDWHPVEVDEVVMYGCWAWAHDNDRAKRAEGTPSSRVNPYATDAEVDYVGKRGEWAVAKALGLLAFYHLRIGGGGDGGVDLTYKGLTIDVKTSSNVLHFASLNHFRADLAILVVPYGTRRDPYLKETDRHAWRNVAIVGFITREEFARIARPYTFASGHRHVQVHRNQLHPLHELPGYEETYE